VLYSSNSNSNPALKAYVANLGESGIYVHASDDAHDVVPVANAVTHAGCHRSSSVSTSTVRSIETSGNQLKDNIALESAGAGAGAGTNGTKPKHKVAFLMSDGDNIQWMFNNFALDATHWWGSPDRGKAFDFVHPFEHKFALEDAAGIHDVLGLKPDHMCVTNCKHLGHPLLSPPAGLLFLKVSTFPTPMPHLELTHKPLTACLHKPCVIFLKARCRSGGRSPRHWLSWAWGSSLSRSQAPLATHQSTGTG
jgi:hypothetical protein